MFLTTRAGLPITSIALIESDADSDGFHIVHYAIGAGPRETVAHASTVDKFLNRFEDDDE